MCAVWKWHLLHLIILQASAVTKVLRFLFSLQRLRLIEIYDVKRLQLRYATSLIGWGSRDHCFSWFSLFESTFESILSDNLLHCYSFTSTIQHNYKGLCGVTDHSLLFLFSGPSTLATFAAVYALFGPTFPGIYDKERGIYTLFYPVRHDKLLWLFFLLFSSWPVVVPLFSSSIIIEKLLGTRWTARREDHRFYVTAPSSLTPAQPSRECQQDIPWGASQFHSHTNHFVPTTQRIIPCVRDWPLLSIFHGDSFDDGLEEGIP